MALVANVSRCRTYGGTTALRAATTTAAKTVLTITIDYKLERI